MLMKRQVVEKIGGFDPRYGVGYFEDDDLNLRAHLAGFRCWIVDECFVHHFGSKSFDAGRVDSNASIRRNWDVFKEKWVLPPDLDIRAEYDVRQILQQTFDPGKHFFPLKEKPDFLALGEEFFSRGDLENAARMFDIALRYESNCAEALNNLGTIAFHQKEPDLALSFFRRALHADPNQVDALINLGDCCIAQRKFSEAVPYLQRARELKPEETRVLNSLGNCLMQAEDLSGAVQVYQHSYRIDPAQAYIREILKALQQFQEPLEEYLIEKEKNQKKEKPAYRLA